MSDDDVIKDIKEILEKVFDNVNHWLDFAEAKNAALIVFNIALITVLSAWNNMHLNVLRSVIMLGCILSTIVTLWSFWPRCNIKKKFGVITSYDNYLFYKDIAKYTYEEYLKIICEEYFNKDPGTLIVKHKLLIQYAEEIISLSKITLKKYQLFQIGVAIDIISLIITALFIIMA